MSDLKAELLARLCAIEGLEDRPSPVAGGTALFYRGRELGHFHHAGELDLKLGRKHIAALGLQHPPGSAFHPARSAGSPWIELRFGSPDEVRRVVEIVRVAVGDRARTGDGRSPGIAP